MGQAEGYGLIAEYFSNGPSLCVVCLSTADELLSHTLLSPLAMDGSSISRLYDPTTKVLCCFLSSIVAPPISNRLGAILISILSSSLPRVESKLDTPDQCISHWLRVLSWDL